MHETSIDLLFDQLLNTSNKEEKIKEDKIKEEIINEIKSFNKWLNTEDYSKNEFVFTNIFIDPVSDGDWIMKVKKNKNDEQLVSFNPKMLKESSKKFFKLVVLHEFFHLLVQKVPNKEDATKIKDNYGSDFMNIIDIQADFYVALYLKTQKDYCNRQYWTDYFDGVKVFKDEWIRNKKFERFLGSVLTINKLFAEDKSFDLFLPSISPLFTENHLKVIVLKREHIYFANLDIGLEDLKYMKEIYSDPTQYNIDGYYSKIINFAKKAGIKELEAEVNPNSN